MKRTFSQFFIDHPRTAWVAAIVLVLCGGLCFSRMAVSEYPNITPVTISVSANYTGASAEVTIDTVAQVIEDQINAVEDSPPAMSSERTPHGHLQTKPTERHSSPSHKWHQRPPA